ncbi:MAG: prefoldin subunit alpha [Candidatus Methanogaster sp.]|uniref:Prefoldin subunit alpha n=1 Tax=Candidatus Methanogaster sp. TaxID=3386292 RepID=A0AC61L0W3_9EURY|nr:MAG: prefoldin subunit alpha [ANME-2 cluster archaeon]
MSGQPTNDELQRLVAQHDEHQARAEMLAEQMEAIQISIIECERAVNAIDALKNEDEAASLVPIGAGSFMHAKLVKPDRTIISLGSNVSAEMSSDAAKDRLIDRREKLAKILEQMNQTMGELAKKIQAIQAEATKKAQVGQPDQAYI